MRYCCLVHMEEFLTEYLVTLFITLVVGKVWSLSLVTHSVVYLRHKIPYVNKKKLSQRLNNGSH